MKFGMRVFLVLFGVLVSFGLLWGGFYLRHILGDWAEFPAILTAIFGFPIGGMMVVAGLVGELP